MHLVNVGLPHYHVHNCACVTGAITAWKATSDTKGYYLMAKFAVKVSHKLIRTYLAGLVSNCICLSAPWSGKVNVITAILHQFFIPLQ